jgi:cell wall-associated NlpC family hydrolase
MAATGERILVMEMLATEIIVSVREISKGNAPKPTQYISSLAVFAVLGGVSMGGEKWAKLAATIGGVTLLAVLLNAQAQVTGEEQASGNTAASNGIIGQLTALVSGQQVSSGPSGPVLTSVVRPTVSAEPTVTQEAEAEYQGQGATQTPSSGSAIGSTATLASATVNTPILSIAAQWVGTPYGQAAQAQKGVIADCSSFVQSVFASVGVSLPRTTYQQVNTGSAVADISEALPGDLLFFEPSGEVPNSHVGIYAGNGLMYDAPTWGQTVGLHSIQGYGPITAIRREPTSSGTLT